MTESAQRTRSSRNMKWGVSALVIVTALTTVGISSYANGVAMLSGAATEHDLTVKATLAERAVTTTQEDALNVGHLCVAVEAKAKRYLEDAIAEEKHGALSGFPGAGPVTHAYRGASQELESLVESCREIGTQIETATRTAQEKAGALRSIAQDRNIPLMERVGLFGNQAGELELDLVTLRQHGQLTEAIRHVGNGLQGNAPETTGRSLAPGQLRAMEDARARMIDDSAMLSAFADELTAETEKVRASASFDPLPPAVAVLRYWREFALWWATALALDLSVIIILGWLVLGRVRPVSGE